MKELTFDRNKISHAACCVYRITEELKKAVLQLQKDSLIAEDEYDKASKAAEDETDPDKYAEVDAAEDLARKNYDTIDEALAVANEAVKVAKILEENLEYLEGWGFLNIPWDKL